jgi:hypothetical protein
MGYESLQQIPVGVEAFSGSIGYGKKIFGDELYKAIVRDVADADVVVTEIGVVSPNPWLLTVYPKGTSKKYSCDFNRDDAGRCCVKRGSIAFAKSQLTMIGLLFASGASSSSSSPSSSHGNHATKWHLVARLLGLPLVP